MRTMTGCAADRLLASFLVALLLSGFATGPAQAQGVADSIQQALGPEQLREYRRQRLSVQIETETQRTVEITGDRYYNYFTDETVTERTVRESGETYKKWIPYQGFQQIKEAKFFRIAGYPDLAQKARTYHTKRVKESWIHWWTPLAGGVAVLGGYGLATGVPPDATPQSVGTALGVVVTAAVFFVYDLVTPGYDKTVYANPGSRWAPASQVHGIAGEYNRQLFREIKGPRDRPVAERSGGADRQRAERQGRQGKNRQQNEGRQQVEDRQSATERSPRRAPARFPVTTAAVASDVEDALSLPRGARKATVSEGNLQEGDVITAAGGETLSQPGQLDQIVERHGAGDKLELEVLRGGDSRTLSVTLGEGQRPAQSAASDGALTAQLPVEITDVAADLEEAISLPKGAKKVTSEGRTGRSEDDLRGGDIITAIEGRDLSEEGSLRQIIQRHDVGDRLTLTVLRGGESRTVTVVLENGR